jgi:hypothetical protein
MALNQSRRLRADDLDSDRAAVVAIHTLNNYAPLNPTYSAPVLAERQAERDQAQHAELRAQYAFDAARDAATAAEWALHNAVLGARIQVLAQYGDDSDAIQSLGLKKKSDRKRPVRRAA